MSSSTATSVPLHPKPAPSSTTTSTTSALPQLIQTPSGLALLELQGKINFSNPSDSSGTPAEIGRLAFPDWDPAVEGMGDGWMKRVFLFVGPHQRLTGEVKKLPKPIAIVRRRGGGEGGEGNGLRGAVGDGDGEGERPDELEVAEVVKYKIIFSNRPEPVGVET